MFFITAKTVVFLVFDSLFIIITVLLKIDSIAKSGREAVVFVSLDGGRGTHAPSLQPVQLLFSFGPHKWYPHERVFVVHQFSINLPSVSQRSVNDMLLEILLIVRVPFKV